jgi:hypothetical protein
MFMNHNNSSKHAAENSMENAIKAAAQEYAALIGNMSEQEVLAAIKGGNQSVLRSVLMLMGVAA